MHHQCIISTSSAHHQRINKANEANEVNAAIEVNELIEANEANGAMCERLFLATFGNFGYLFQDRTCPGYEIRETRTRQHPCCLLVRLFLLEGKLTSLAQKHKAISIFETKLRNEKPKMYFSMKTLLLSFLSTAHLKHQN